MSVNGTGFGVEGFVDFRKVTASYFIPIVIVIMLDFLATFYRTSKT